MPRTTKDSEKEELNKKKTSTKKSTTATKKATNTKATTAKKVNEEKVAKATTKKASTTKKKTTSSTTRKKSSVKKLEETIVAEYYDLPYRYNETVVKILYQTPTILFVYWDISDFDREIYIKQYGENFFNNTRPVLKVYNLIFLMKNLLL